MSRRNANYQTSRSNTYQVERFTNSSIVDGQFIDVNSYGNQYSDSQSSHSPYGPFPSTSESPYVPPEPMTGAVMADYNPYTPSHGPYGQDGPYVSREAGYMKKLRMMSDDGDMRAPQDYAEYLRRSEQQISDKFTAIY